MLLSGHNNDLLDTFNHKNILLVKDI